MVGSAITIADFINKYIDFNSSSDKLQLREFFIAIYNTKKTRTFYMMWAIEWDTQKI